MADRALIPSWAADYIGIPFCERGRSRETGVDCWGLARLVLAERFGVDVPSYTERYADTRKRDPLELLIAGEIEALPEVQAGRELPGDAVLCRIVGQPTHIGLVVAPGWMVHCQGGVDSACEEYDGMRWRRRIIGFYRFTGAAC